MTKKKRKSSKQASSDIPPFVPPPMEQMMRDITRMLSEQEFESVDEANEFLSALMASGQQPTSAQARSDLDRAQDLIYQAHEARSKAQMLKLARKALDISPDCADAYVLLAEWSVETLAEKVAFYEAGVKAGERALGDEFEELKGHFWGFIESRPYMRARLGLAMALWAMERLEEAAQHMDAMLELNPNDNQGVRQVYISLLLEIGDTKRLDKLLEQYPDEWSAYWKYSQALYEFRKKGKGGEADKLLTDAIAYNPHVPPYLLGTKRVSKQHAADYYSPGDENEAIDYIIRGTIPWVETPGALAWLKEVLAASGKPK